MNRIGPAANSDVNDPSGFTHVVEVSDRSDSASTRCPDNRAATRADATSTASDAAATGVAGVAGVAGGAGAASAWGATIAPATSTAETATATRRPHPAARTRPRRGPAEPTQAALTDASQHQRDRTRQSQRRHTQS